MTHTKKVIPAWQEIKVKWKSLSRPRKRGRCQPSGWRKGQAWGETEKWFWPLYADLPLSPRRLGTSLRVRGKLTTKEERIHSFKMSKTKKYWNGSHKKSRPAWWEIKERIQTVSRPRMKGSKRTTFRGAERRCKSVWDALPWLRWRR